MNIPLTSVILPTYNRAATLKRAIASVLAQAGGQELELIIADDCSTDATEEIARGCTDPRVRYLRRSKNGGASAARNTGIEAARGQFIAFVDSDDEWLPLKLEKQLNLLRESPDKGMSLCGLLRWEGTQVVLSPAPARRAQRASNVRAEILRQNFGLTSTWLVRREIFKSVGMFEEGLRSLVDWEWLIRYVSRHDIALIEEPLVMIYASPDSISGHDKNYIRSLEFIIGKHTTTLAEQPQALANLHYVAAKKHLLYEDAAQGRRHLRKALRLHPRDLRFWAALLLSALGARLFHATWQRVRRHKGYAT